HRSPPAPSRDSAARKYAAAVASAGTGSHPTKERSATGAAGSCEEHSRQPAPLSARPGIFEPLRFEELEEALARGAVVPLAVAADDLEQGVGAAVAVSGGHLRRSELKPGLVIVGIGGQPLLKRFGVDRGG